MSVGQGRRGFDGAGAAGSDRLEWALLALLLAGVALYWAIQFEPFQVPNNDYASFENVAKRLAAGELPNSFKRTPILPGLMALLAPLLPGPRPLLDAALVWNQFFSLGILLLVFELGRRTLGRGALLAPLALAASARFHTMALQPLVEPSLTFFVVASFVLFERRSRWQWAAAFGVALSRHEAGLIVPVLFVANVLSGGRFWRNVGFAALACSGIAVWTLLSRLVGSGGAGFYFELMDGMGYHAAFGFAQRAVLEPFRGLWAVSGWRAIGFGVAGVVPVVAGAIRVGRSNRALALALGVFWLVAVGIIVAFGIDKTRYVHHTQWIPLFFWGAGVVDLAERVRVAVVARAAGAGPGIALAAAALLAAACLVGARALAAAPHEPAPLAAELMLAGWLLALAVACGLRAGASAGPIGHRLARGLGVALLLAPLVAGGLAAKSEAFFKIYHTNESAVVLARWLERNLGDERVVLLPRTHVNKLVGIPMSQMARFSDFEAETPEELADRLRDAGVSLAVYTFRRDPDDPSERFYYRLHHMRLAEMLRDGGPVPGFEHIATLPLSASLERPAVQVYRVAAAPAAAH